MLNLQLVEKAAGNFAGSGQPVKVETLGQGLIHQTYKVIPGKTGIAFVLQAINQNVFQKPADIIDNYLLVYEFLTKSGNRIRIPAPRYSNFGQPSWTDEAGNFWRATDFIPGSYSPLKAATDKSAREVAEVFAGFTGALADLDTTRLKEIIPGFHNLEQRYLHFESAIGLAAMDRLLKSTHLIAEFRNRKPLVEFYKTIRSSKQYPLRVMHHDCKISNILFNQETHQVICPVDLDTVMPGKFFSDLGDMIRTMACTEDENSKAWEKITIDESFYQAILDGYMSRAANIMTQAEKDHIHHAGLIMIFMQGIRFLTDYLRGDVYYKIEYPEQNLDRALNQFILLGKLESLLHFEYDSPSIV